MSRVVFIVLVCGLAFSLAACSRAAPLGKLFAPPTTAPTLVTKSSPTIPFFFATRAPGTPILTPTPDLPHGVPTLRTTQETYTVLSGDSLGKIALQFSVSVDDLMAVNNLTDPDKIDVGQVLTIPVRPPSPMGPSFKIIPDSELVDGPAAASFDMAAFVKQKGGYLSQYTGDMDGETLDGVSIVARVAEDYSVNPRLLLALLEFRSGWVTHATPDQKTIDYPMAYSDPNRKGLYLQMAFAADNLNRGYYLWRVNALSNLILADDSVVPIAATLNAGTVGVQYLMSLFYNQADWVQAVTEQGLFATYESLFGYPFDYAVDPILPPGLTQPPMQLPFEMGAIWSFTGGPHGGWGEGSAWAALDFAPPGDALGCVQSDAWVVAVTAGKIVRSDHGAVVEDLDGDGIEQTGWTVLYMHTETRDRIPLGTLVKAGDRIGHPSCEGGVANGTHTHLARRYNGEWIPADGPLPFNLDGWISSGTGVEYDGFLTRNGQKVEADGDRRTAANQIQR
jgi:murein DD-endopeptidase MepM/ murein hydrolase activator NlpD